jgi:hypothetical protein
MEAFCKHHCALANASMTVFMQIYKGAEHSPRLFQVKNERYKVDSAIAN